MRSDIVRHARMMVGTPFHHLGRTPGVGLDCIGLIVISARQSGIDVVDTTVYAKMPPKEGLLLPKLAEQMDEVPLDEMQPGDIIVFGKRPYHVAIFAGKTIIHSVGDPGIRKTVENIYDEKWRRLTTHAFRWKN